MALPDEQIVYTLTVEDIRTVVKRAGLRELGDEIDWYECILSAIQRDVPKVSGNRE
jgi:putative ubiquitin-RnfH superfamily antitoxin RatB of RatAB toxin-antitoxin module